MRKLIIEARIFGLKIAKNDEEQQTEEVDPRKTNVTINSDSKLYKFHIFLLTLGLAQILIALPIKIAFYSEVDSDL